MFKFGATLSKLTRRKARFFKRLGKDPQLLVSKSYFLDGNDERRCPHALPGALVVVDFANFTVSVNHGFFEAGVDQIDLIRPVNEILLILLGHRFTDHFLDGSDELLAFD